MMRTYSGVVSVLAITLLWMLLAQLASAAAPPPPPPPDELGPYDIHPEFKAWLGDPEYALTSQWTSRRYLYEGGQPIAPIYVAVGETIHCKDTSEDPDPVMDGEGTVDDDIASWEWSPEGQGSGGEYDKVVQENDGEFIVQCTVDDADPSEDPQQTSMMKFKAVTIDYVVVRPNSDPELLNIAQQSSGSFEGYAYSNGDDELPYYDGLGNPIPGRPNDDIQVQAVFEWSFEPAELGNVDAVQDTAWTHLWHHNLTGEGTITATYTKVTPHVSGSANVKIVNGQYFIDLTGINYDEVQNVPMNAKAPASCDGTGSVGEMKAKVVIEGEANTDYDISLSYDSDNLNIIDPDFSITTDGEGEGEAEIVLSAHGVLWQSSSLEDITISVEMRPDGGGDVLASSKEPVTVYLLRFAELENCTYNDPQSSGHATTSVEGFWAEATATSAGLLEHASLEEDFTMRVEALPSGSLKGQAKARAQVSFSTSIHWYLVKGSWEDGPTVQLSVSWGIVTFELAPAGANNVAGLACDMAVKMPSHADWQQYGGGMGSAFEQSTAQHEVGFGEYYDEWEDTVPAQYNVPDGEERTYSVGSPTQTFTVKLLLTIAARTSLPWAGPANWCSGCGASGSIDSNQGTDVEDLDGVFEIVEIAE
jgi:hypothetical protein